jgi:putative IMPACT (imprinted ancient) family translation regulator
MLNALIHGGVGDVAAVVTRYFGGTKLGTGGLVRAYGGCVKRALEHAPRTRKVDWASVRVQLDYSELRAVEHLYPRFGVERQGEEFAGAVTHRLRLPASRLEEFRRAVLDVTRGRGKVEVDESPRSA